MKVAHDRGDLRDDVCRHRAADESRQPFFDDLIRWEIGLPQDLLHARFDDVGRKRAGPPSVGRRKQEAPGKSWLPTVELEGQARTERKTPDVWSAKTERVDER